MSIDSKFVEATGSGFPAGTEPAEPDIYCRQAAMPGHKQQRLGAAHVVVVGCGGLGSWIALGLARMGVGQLTVIDDDHYNLTNAPRQLMFAEDIGEPKARALARNVQAHMTAPGRIRGMVHPFQGVADSLRQVDAIIVGVDNNATRLSACIWALRARVPAVFAMLSADGQRAQIFRQDVNGPCLSCVLPNLDPETAAPCAAASIASCFLAASHAVSLAASALMKLDPPRWRETSLDGTTERTGSPPKREGCQICG